MSPVPFTPSSTSSSRFAAICGADTFGVAKPDPAILRQTILRAGGQIPLALAQKCFDAVGSRQKTFKIFYKEEGGFHHCQVDNITIGVHFMWDWIADVLKPVT